MHTNDDVLQAKAGSLQMTDRAGPVNRCPPTVRSEARPPFATQSHRQVLDAGWNRCEEGDCPGHGHQSGVHAAFPSQRDTNVDLCEGDAQRQHGPQCIKPSAVLLCTMIYTLDVFKVPRG